LGTAAAEDDDEGGAEGDGDDEEEEEEQTAGAGRGYNKADYAHLSVGPDVRELFEFIDLCKPTDIELESKFKPFIPEFIPAVGEIDPFLKPARPDGGPERLGITVLDEPGKQSDPTVLEMVLRLQSKRANLPMMEVRGIEHAERKPREVLAWVERIAQLHQTSQAITAVQYARPMPAIESLMEEWPPEVEQLLERVRLPTGDVDMDIRQFVRVACAILDIPVHDGNLVQSLHVLFTLFTAFKDNQFFRAREAAAGSSASGILPPPGTAPPPTAQLIFTPPTK
jgi:intraflagellar transport protein 46